MPLTRSTQSRRTPAKSTPAPAFQEPLVPDNDGRPTDHNGIPIEREELLGNLPTGAHFRISKLHLANEETAFACRDCDFTADQRSEVMQHRNEAHGARFGKRTPKVTFNKDTNLGDVVLPPRANGFTPSNPMEMTLAECLALAPSIGAIGDLITQVEAERDQAIADLHELRIWQRANAHAVAVHDSLQAEVIDLRLMIKNSGSYEQLKTEVNTLRAWKKKITAKLNAVGFKLAEDEE